MKKLLMSVLVLIVLVSTLSVHAQHRCIGEHEHHVSDPNDPFELLWKDMQGGASARAAIRSGTKYRFKVVQHVFRKKIDDEIFLLSAEEEELENSIANLNEAFAAADIEFVVCELNYIDVSSLPTSFKTNYQLGADETKYCDPNDVSDAINIYYTPKINFTDEDGSTYEIAGRSDFPAYGYSGNRIVINHSVCETSVMIHEMGHFFNLYHTFDRSKGTERANGSNCQKAGDLVCDTPAEKPAPTGSYYIDKNCKYTGPATDSYGDEYHPLTNNYMTYTEKPECRTSFTDGQLDRMLIYGLSSRYSMMIPYKTEFNSTIYANEFHAPNSGAIVEVNKVISSVLYSTSSIEANSNVQFIADHKIILQKGFHVTKGSKFKARIFDFCDLPVRDDGVIMMSPFRIEKTADANISEEAEHAVESVISIAPNPNNGAGIITFVSAENCFGDISIYDSQGKKIYSSDGQEIVAGRNDYVFEISDSPSNIYYAIINANGKKYSGRFVILR